MAKVRFSHLDDFVLKDDGKVGIGTSLPSARVEVIGTVRAANIKSDSGITTVTSIDGYMNQNMEYSDTVSINTGDSRTLSGEIVVGSGLTMSVGTGATTGQGNIESMKVSNTFNPPIGGTNDRPTAPKPGALFYNKDFKTIEYWDGNSWRQVDNTTRRGRGLFGGGVSASPANDSRIEFFNMATKGNSTNFGDRTISANNASACSSATRALFCGGGDPAGNNTIDYVTIASEGDAIDFGERTSKQFSTGSCGSSTRGLTGGGNPASNIIDYHQFSTLGNSLDFGDLNATQFGIASASSSTRGFWLGGTNLDGIIQKVTISSTGNAVDFGNLIEKTKNGRACSNTTRLIKGAGVDNENRLTIESFNMASGGNSIFFGNLTELSTFPAAMSSETRGIFCGGRTPTSHNIIQFITIATSGNAEDFGDITQPNQKMAGCSDSHGGLGGY